MELETERLILREFQEGDWQAMHEYASDPEVVRYMQWMPKTEEETREYVRRAIANQQEELRRNYQFVLILKAEKRLIGQCSIINVSSPEDGEAGMVYVLKRDFWNRGYMTEAVERVIHFGFSELGLHRIYATLAPENVSSARVLEKAGMRREGHLREHKWVKGEWRDSLLYAILESERR